MKYFFLGLKQLFCKIRHFKDEKESGLSFFFRKEFWDCYLGQGKKITNREIREIKIHVYCIRQTANVSGEFLRIENKKLKKVQNDSCGQN